MGRVYSPPRGRYMRLLGAALMLAVLAFPAATFADHCGAVARASPPDGEPGTVFLLEPNLGGPTTVHIYQDGRLVSSQQLDEDATVLTIATSAEDAGEWRAVFELTSQPGCQSEASFRVLAAPDTSTTTDQPRPGAWVYLIPVAAGLAAAGLWLLRSDGRRRPGYREARDR